MFLRFAPYVGLIAIVAISLIGYGRYQYKEGQRDLLATIEKARVKSIKEKAEIDDEISALTDDELLRRALGWVRQTPGR